MANRSNSKSPPSLREQAEAAWQGRRRGSATIAPKDAGALVHELEVHQIELELQNEELRRAQIELEESRDQLRESRDELSDLYDFAPVGYLTLSEDTVVLRANLRAAALLGVERHALMGKRFSRFLAGESRDAFHFYWRALVPDGSPQACDLLLRKSDGTAFHVSMETAEEKGAKPRAWRCAISDITARKHAEAKLRESEERFRIMADTAPVMIWVSDPEEQGLFFNRPWLEFTGGTLEEEQNAGWMAGVHPEDVERTRTIYTSAFEARRSFQMEFRLRRADGEYRWVVCNGAPRFALHGVLGGYVASCIDVSDIKRAQEEVLAVQRLESLGVLASGVAHDFNNMIGGIMANAELAVSQSSAEKSNKHLQNIVSLAAHGGEIVRQLMTYGGVESQAAEPVSLSALVEEMIDLLKVSVSERVVLKTDLDKTLPPVLANRAQLRQVVMNLVINASEAIGEGEGEVRIVTSRGKPRAQDRLAAGDYVRLEVSDTGRGMTPEVQAKMFEPFFTTKFAGRGLGLAVIQRVIKRHKGEIIVTSTPGEGTMFEILLPCADTGFKEKEIPTPGRAAGKQAGERTKQTGKVLMVEDAVALRSAVSEALRMQGFGVIEAGDGTAAVKEVRAHADDIDVIVLDVMLPGIPSWEVLREARLRPGIKIVLTSAYNRD